MLTELLAATGFRRAAVVGAGLMGRRIAGVLAGGGLDVVLTDAAIGVLDEAVREADEVAGDGGRVSAQDDLAVTVAGAELVVEAISEDLAAKQELFGVVAELAPLAVLATNTSVLPISAVAEKVIDGGRVVGTHWWNPPDLMPIVEVVRGERTDPGVVDRVVDLLEHLGKVPVRVERDVPGFIGNRLQHALWREAIALVAEGVCDASTVDLVVRNTLGLRLREMGPIENADYVGLDLTLAIHEAVLPGMNSCPHPSPLLRELVWRGELGAKSGRGFLEWPPGSRERARERLAVHVAAQLERRRRSGRRRDETPRRSTSARSGDDQ